jgi:hypothetical protein
MNIEKRDGFISIAASGFCGRYESSPNGCFDIAFASSGQFVLLESDQVVFQGEVNAPLEACVSNYGTFLIGASPSLKTLHSELAAFDLSGKKLFNKKFDALLHRVGIAPAGRFAVSQTAMSNGDDSSTLAFFDLALAKEVWRTPWIPWADSYEFDKSRAELVLVYDRAGRFRFTFAGEFLDANHWRVARIRLLDGKALISAVQDFIVAGPTPSQAEDLIRSIEEVNSRTSETESPKYAAAVKRALGFVRKQFPT